MATVSAAPTSGRARVVFDHCRMSCCRESTVGQSGQRRSRPRSMAQSRRRRVARIQTLGGRKRGGMGASLSAAICPGRNEIAHAIAMHAGCSGSTGKRLEAFQEATAHVRARLCAAGTRMITGHVVGTGGHRRHVGFGRRQRDTGRNGGQRHHHGEDAKGHEPTMQRTLHSLHCHSARSATRTAHPFASGYAKASLRYSRQACSKICAEDKRNKPAIVAATSRSGQAEAVPQTARAAPIRRRCQWHHSASTATPSAHWRRRPYSA